MTGVSGRTQQELPKQVITRKDRRVQWAPLLQVEKKRDKGEKAKQRKKKKTVILTL